MISEEKIKTQNPKSKKVWKFKLLIVLAVLIILVIAEFIYSNTYIDVENFTYKNESVPKGFDGAVIVQISDYHNHGGSYDDRLISNIKEQNPDYIFITGDSVDAGYTNVDVAINFLERVSEIAPCYMVWGNHELKIDLDDFEKLESAVRSSDITLLEQECTVVTRNGDNMFLYGTQHMPTIENFSQTGVKDDDFFVNIHHYPEDIDRIASVSRETGSQVDLVFCGHAHGGLICLPPFLKGLYAPGQEFFPKYTSGEYQVDGTTMILSRGLGNSGWTKRFFDPFHLVVCTLESED